MLICFFLLIVPKFKAVISSPYLVLIYILSMFSHYPYMGLHGVFVYSLNNTLSPLSFILVGLSLFTWATANLSMFKELLDSLKGKTLSFNMSLNLLILSLFFYSSNLIEMYIYFEVSLVPISTIILGWGYQPERVPAAIFLISYMLFASLPLLVYFLFKTTYLGSSNLVFSSYYYPPWTLSSGFQALTTLFALLAFFTKIPVYGLHLWLPKAHLEAPVGGSMILAAILLKLGIFGGLLFKNTIFPLCVCTNLAISVFIFGGVAAALVCGHETDIKLLVAYSSVAHMAITALSICVNSPWACSGAALMAMAHGFSSSGMFLGANFMYQRSNSRSMILNKGILSWSPLMSLMWFSLCMSNMGAPPSFNLLSEILMVISAASFSMVWGAFSILLAFLAVVYNILVFALTQYGKTPLGGPLTPLAPLELMNSALITLIPYLLTLCLFPLMVY